MSPIQAFCVAFPILFLGLALVPIGINAASFPKNKLPPHICLLCDEGERPEFSLDGTKVMYVTKGGGEVYEIDIETKEKKLISKHYSRPDGEDYYRAFYLSNGDYFLTGGTHRYSTKIQILDKSLTRAPTVIDEIVRAGPAISRTKLKIAWTFKLKKIWTADIVYRTGVPELANKKLIIDSQNVEVDGKKYYGMIEPQTFRPPLEEELIFAQYSWKNGFNIEVFGINLNIGLRLIGKLIPWYDGDENYLTAEVFGVNLKTGKITNYSKAPHRYDEPEGIFPNGEYTLVESDSHNPRGIQYLDIYRMKLDGTGEDFTRLTFFNDTVGYKATNPVIRGDGKYMAFQEARTNEEPGVGHGIYLFDLE